MTKDEFSKLPADVDNKENKYMVELIYGMMDESEKTEEENEQVTA